MVPIRYYLVGIAVFYAFLILAGCIQSRVSSKTNQKFGEQTGIATVAVAPEYSCNSDSDCVCDEYCGCINEKFLGKLTCISIVHPCTTGKEVCACIEGRCKSVKVATVQKT